MEEYTFKESPSNLLEMTIAKDYLFTLIKKNFAALEIPVGQEIKEVKITAVYDGSPSRLSVEPLDIAGLSIKVLVMRSY